MVDAAYQMKSLWIMYVTVMKGLLELTVKVYTMILYLIYILLVDIYLSSSKQFSEIQDAKLIGYKVDFWNALLPLHSNLKCIQITVHDFIKDGAKVQLIARTCIVAALHPCYSEPCHNQASCVEQPNAEWYCLCGDEFTGELCEGTSNAHLHLKKTSFILNK